MSDEKCEQCDLNYHQPFRQPHLRFLWWLDDRLHRSHASHGWRLHLALCNFLDRRLWKADLQDAAMAEPPCPEESSGEVEG